MRCTIIAFWLILASSTAAWAQVERPFTNGLPGDVKKSLTGGDQDPLGIWPPDELKSGGTKSLKSEANSYALALTTASGLIVLSQLWNDDCGPHEALSKVVLLRKDNSRATLLDETCLPQILPDDAAIKTKTLVTKDAAVAPVVSLTGDEKGLVVQSVIEGDVVKRTIPFQASP